MIKHTTDTSPLKEAFYKAFKSPKPFAPVGQEQMVVKAVLYPTNVYYLELDQFNALTTALKICGENEFFISLTETESDLFEKATFDDGEYKHWICKMTDFEEYMSIDLFMENAIYSSKGTWGVLMSHESHALLVCDESFWNEFQKSYPDWEDNLKEFTNLWQTYNSERGVNIEWLQPFISHLTKY